MSARTTFRSASSSDSATLEAFKTIAEELGQDSKQCRVTVVVMDGHPLIGEFALSEIQNQPFAQFAEQHESTSWGSIWIRFEPLPLHVRLDRDQELGDDKITVSFEQDPRDPVDVSRSLVAIQKQFVPLNRAAAIEQALALKWLNSIGYARKVSLDRKRWYSKLQEIHIATECSLMRNYWSTSEC